jgi:hypothetical protein
VTDSLHLVRMLGAPHAVCVGDACVDANNAGHQFGSMFRVRCRAPYAANV